jgi:hypothetical protein
MKLFKTLKTVFIVSQIFSLVGVGIYVAVNPDLREKVVQVAKGEIPFTSLFNVGKLTKVIPLSKEQRAGINEVCKRYRESDPSQIERLPAAQRTMVESVCKENPDDQ